MAISVLIPAFNGARTIAATLQSVLGQTARPDEILVLNDGSTDETASILDSFRPEVTIFHQRNQGVAAARNFLCGRAQGDLIAFLDQDDLWHPRYLETQIRSFQQYPNACGLFTWHVNFAGYGGYEWDPGTPEIPEGLEFIDSRDFLVRYNRATGQFASMSYCCVPKRVLRLIGPEPFCLSGVDDSYLNTLLPLLGGVIFNPTALVAYRVTDSAQSVDRLKMFGLWVRVFELLAQRYNKEADLSLRQVFAAAFASKRRQYGRLLMSSGNTAKAREQFGRSIRDCVSPSSVLKSLLLLGSTYCPRVLQPEWPPLYRRWKDPA